MRGNGLRVGYVLKRYPRYSETFIVNEVLAHTAAGLPIEIFALRRPVDSRFQDLIARVEAPVTYVRAEGLTLGRFWDTLAAAGEICPGIWDALAGARGAPSRLVYQAVLVAHEVRARGVTHLHAHFATDASVVARLAAGVAGVPYTFTAHAKDIFHESVADNHLQHLLADAAAVVTVSDFNLAHLRTRFGDVARRLRRVYNGLDFQRFPYVPPADRPACIVAIGRLIEKKGFGDLIDACAILASRRVVFDCRIIGAGPLEDTWRARIAQVGLEARVSIEGARPQEEVIRYLQRAAVCAAPCVVGEDGNRDGLPTVLLEAMALGTPCVATGVTGIPEVIRHEDTGLMVPQHDPPALAAALERLLTDPALGVRLATQARHLIESEFDIHRNAASLRAIFASEAAPPSDERKPSR
jgi:glycosyltransferase involved in cell wall biosynthesis